MLDELLVMFYELYLIAENYNQNFAHSVNSLVE